MPTFYQLLSLPPTASADEIKKAFRAEIARYHPDKVQHLGKEFQEMAATRAAQLTEAYRTLMSPDLRAEYDRMYTGETAATAPPTAPAAGSPPPPAAAFRPEASEQQAPQAPPQVTQAAADAAAKRPARFATEHATRDEFVKKATLARIRQVITAEHGGITELPTKGFDFDCTAKSKKLFGRANLHRLAVRFVPTVDRASIQDTWAMAQKAGGNICVLLMGNGLAGARELGDAITEMRRKARGGDGGVSVIPVDVRDWSAHMPADAPPMCKNILLRLRESST